MLEITGRWKTGKGFSYRHSSRVYNHMEDPNG